MKEHRISTVSNSDRLRKSCNLLRWSRNELQHFLNNKRGYSTEGSTLLPSVLRPRLFGIGVVVGVATLVGTIFNLTSNQVSATSATLSVPDNISVNVNPSTNNGFAESTPGQVEISTGNQAGYTLSIRAKDNNQLKNGSNALDSITTNLTADQYRTGDYVNTWGFKPDVVNSLANTSYLPGPTASGIVLAKTNANSKLPETYNLAIATKVNGDTVAGNYTNTFVLTGTANTATYTINFDNNGGTGGPQAAQTGLIGDDLEVQIESETPSIAGKDFLGWCTKKPKEDGRCTGVIVQPAGCFPLCKCDLNITLYAMYGTKTASGGGGSASGAFSGVSNGTGCENAGQQGKVYAGLCWMDKDYKTSRTWAQAMGDCPAGWRLPSWIDFTLLIDTSAGLGDGNGLYGAGWNGDYWSSTPLDYGSNASVYRLIVDSSGARIFSDNYVKGNYSVRCVAG